MKNLFAVALILIIAVACDDEQDVVAPTKTKLLNVEIDDSYKTDELDNWVVVHDDDGRLLASKSFESNMTFEVETDLPVSEKITVTTISHYFRSGVHYYSVYSYAKVAKGKTLIFENNFSTDAIIGNVNVTVSDVVDFKNYSLSPRRGTSGSATWSSGTNLLEMQAGTFAGFSKYILSISTGSQMKYKVLDNVQANDNYSFSFNDMLPFDKIVTFTFPTCNNFTSYIIGSEPGVTTIPNRYNLLSLYASDPTSSFQAAYLNSLTGYVTGLNLNYVDYSVEYTNVGSIPDPNITWPVKTDFGVTTSSINDYAINANKPYVWRTASWRFFDTETFTTWVVYSPTDEQAFAEMPAEIIAQHPGLSLSKLNYNGTKIYTQAAPYDEYVDTSFGAAPVWQGLTIGIGF